MTSGEVVSRTIVCVTWSRCAVRLSVSLVSDTRGWASPAVASAAGRGRRGSRSPGKLLDEGSVLSPARAQLFQLHRWTSCPSFPRYLGQWGLVDGEEAWVDPQVLALWSTDSPEVSKGRGKLLEHDVHAAEHATFHTHGAGTSFLGTERDLLGEV